MTERVLLEPNGRPAGAARTRFFTGSAMSTSGGPPLPVLPPLRTPSLLTDTRVMAFAPK